MAAVVVVGEVVVVALLALVPALVLVPESREQVLAQERSLVETLQRSQV